VPEQPVEVPGGTPAEPAVPAATLGLATETLGDLYAQQGFGERAAEIYRQLLRQDPARADLREKLERLLSAEPTPAAAGVPGGQRAGTIALLERWREAARRRKGAQRGGGA